MEAIEYGFASAAQEQLTFAIIAFRVGAWATTITLCGAAEECLPKVSQETAFSIYNRLRADRLSKSGMQANDQPRVNPNFVRNWLKHNGNRPPEIIICEHDASFMIIRAISRLEAAYPSWLLCLETKSFIAALDTDALGKFSSETCVTIELLR